MNKPGIPPQSFAAVSVVALGMVTRAQASAVTTIPTLESSLAQSHCKSRASCDKFYKNLSMGYRLIPAPPATAACRAAVASSPAACLAAN